MREQIEQFKSQLQAEMGNLKAQKAAAAERLAAIEAAIEQQVGAILACEHLLNQAQAAEPVQEATDAQN